MRNVIAVVFLAFSGLAAADPTTQAQDSLLNLKEIDAYHTEPYPLGYANWGDRKPDTSHCKKLGEHASTVMKHRQGGTPMSRLMDAIGGNEIGEAMIIAAYEHPRYSVKANQREAMTDFANDVMVACYKGGA